MLKTRLYLCLATFLFAFGLQAQTPWIAAAYSDTTLQMSQIPFSKLTYINHIEIQPLDGTGTNWQAPPAANAKQLISAAAPYGTKVLIMLYVGPQVSGGTALHVALENNFNAVVNYIVNYVNSNGYAGVDFDWEGDPDSALYEQMITAVAAQLPGKIFTMDVYIDSNLQSTAVAMQKTLGAINIMCYDMDNSSAGYTWYNDTVYRESNEDVNYQRSCEDYFNYFNAAGVPANKLGAGIPFYGTIWTGCANSACSDGIHSLDQSWSSVDYDRGQGYNKIAASEWWSYPHSFDSTHVASYISVNNPGASNDAFVTFTDPTQIQGIVSWAKSKGLGGFLEFELYLQFMSGASGDAQNPLATAVYNAVQSDFGSSGGSGSGSSPAPSPTPKPVATPTPVSGSGPTSSGARLEALALGKDGNVYVNWQTSPGGSWNDSGAWTPLGGNGNIAAAPVVDLDGTGRLEAMALGKDGNVYMNWQTSPGGGWFTTKAWTSAGGNGNLAQTPALALDAKGRLEAMALGKDGNVYMNWQTSVGGNWANSGAWTSVGGSGNIASSPVVALDGQGRLEAIALGKDGNVYINWQTSPGGSWARSSAWLCLGGSGNIAATPALALDGQSRLEAMALGKDGDVYMNWQTSVGGSWANTGTWKLAGGNGNIAMTPALALDGQGRLEAIALAKNGTAYMNWQKSSGGAWFTYGSWTAAGGDGGIGSAPQLVLDGQGRLEAMALGTGGNAQINWQTSPGGSWADSGAWNEAGGGGNLEATPVLKAQGQ